MQGLQVDVTEIAHSYFQGWVDSSVGQHNGRGLDAQKPPKLNNNEASSYRITQ